MKRAIVRLVLLVGMAFGGAAVGGALEDATAAYGRGDYATALPLFQSLGAEGNSTAQLYLGYMSRDGRGVAKDDEEAMQWFRKAAEQGNAGGQNALGDMYENGRGVPKDDAQAVQWYRKAAEQGNAYGENNLGRAYRDGRSVTQDDAAAVAWFRKAAEHGNANGQNNLGAMYENGRGVPKDDAQAVQWYRKAAEQGNVYGENNLGRAYRDGRSVTQDDAAAVAWFRKAAEQRLAAAQASLDLMYEQGRGVSKDEAQAAGSHRTYGLGLSADSNSRTYAVLSVIGDKISVIGHEATVGSRLDNNQHVGIAVTDRALDNIAVLAAKDAINRLDAHAAVVLLTSDNPTLFALQDRLFEVPEQATATLEMLRAMLRSQNATHLVFITKHRDEAALHLEMESEGSGYIEGLGFYVDQTIYTKDTKTNAKGLGFIAPFAYIKVLLVDATTMTVIREQTAKESTATSTAHVSGTLNPWDALTREQKVNALKYLINRAIAHAMPTVLGTK